MINVYSNLRCVVHNGINAAQLLEDHEEHANKHSPSCRSHEQIRELSPLRRPLHTMIITSIDAHIHARTQSDTIGQIMVNLRSSNHLFLKRRLDVRDLVLCHNMCCAKSLQRLSSCQSHVILTQHSVMRSIQPSTSLSLPSRNLGVSGMNADATSKVPGMMAPA